MSAAQRRWLVALGALESERLGNKAHDQLGGAQAVVENAARGLRELREADGLFTLDEVLAALARPPTAPEALPFARHFAGMVDVSRVGSALEAHRAAALAGRAHLAGLEQGALIGALHRHGSRARAAYGSWDEYGWHVLVGLAASTGEWSDAFEEAYRRLVEEPASPWRTIAWESYSPKGQGPTPVRLRALLRCTRCLEWTSMTRLAPSVTCASCFSALVVPESVWSSLRINLARAAPAPLGYAHQGHDYGNEVELSLRLDGVWPDCACGHAHGQELVASASSGSHACGSCGASVAVRSVTLPGMRHEVVIVGESEEVAPVAAEHVVLACEVCGGPLAVGTSRDVACGYCRHTTRVPEGLWSRLYPSSLDASFTLILPAAEGSP